MQSRIGEYCLSINYLHGLPVVVNNVGNLMYPEKLVESAGSILSSWKNSEGISQTGIIICQFGSRRPTASQRVAMVGENRDYTHNDKGTWRGLEVVHAVDPTIRPIRNYRAERNNRGIHDFASLLSTNECWSDFNIDGLTDNADLAIIREHLGTKCSPRR